MVKWAGNQKVAKREKIKFFLLTGGETAKNKDPGTGPLMQSVWKKKKREKSNVR